MEPTVPQDSVVRRHPTSGPPDPDPAGAAEWSRTEAHVRAGIRAAAARRSPQASQSPSAQASGSATSASSTTVPSRMIAVKPTSDRSRFFDRLPEHRVGCAAEIAADNRHSEGFDLKTPGVLILPANIGNWSSRYRIGPAAFALASSMSHAVTTTATLGFDPSGRSASRSEEIAKEFAEPHLRRQPVPLQCYLFRLILTYGRAGIAILGCFDGASRDIRGVSLRLVRRLRLDGRGLSMLD